MLFVAFGIGAGVGLTMLRMLLHRGVKDPHVIEQKLGLPVYVTIPHSEAQDAQSRSIKAHLQGTHLLAHSHPDDIAIESLRSLRTTLHFSLADAPNRVIVFAGPSPGIGKSFVSANFAAVLAQGGGKVLLVDGDMRKGTLHHYFGVKSRKNGLSEVLAGQRPWEEVVHRTAVPGLEVMFSGMVPPNPSELLMKDRFAAFVAEVSEAYTYVIFDAPPMMAVTDALILGAKAGTFLLLAKFGQHPLDEIRTCQARCEDIGIHISGCVFNDIRLSELSDRYYRYGYHYHYK
jgi:tyrosine-protein kinase Etk/Wzc